MLDLLRTPSASSDTHIPIRLAIIIHNLLQDTTRHSNFVLGPSNGSISQSLLRYWAFIYWHNASCIWLVNLYGAHISRIIISSSEFSRLISSILDRLVLKYGSRLLSSKRNTKTTEKEKDEQKILFPPCLSPLDACISRFVIPPLSHVVLLDVHVPTTPSPCVISAPHQEEIHKPPALVGIFCRSGSSFDLTYVLT